MRARSWLPLLLAGGLLLAACGSSAPEELPAQDPAPAALAAPPAEPPPATAEVAEVAPPPEADHEVPAAEVRGVWAHLFDDTLKTRAGIDRFLDDAAAANLNTVIVEVVRRQDAYYDSAVLPRTVDPALEPGLDVVGYATDQARARGLAIHAWFPGVQAYHHVYDGLPRPGDWVWERHGPGAPEGDRWVTRDHQGAWGEYLDLGVPAVQDLLVATAAELAAAYPVDALHLDYIRYDGREWGYHPVAVARFQAETGRTDVPAPDDAQWSDWRREQTRVTVARIRQAVAEADPAVGVSAAVIAQGEGPHAGKPFSETIAYTQKLQDWPGWLRDGLVDAAYPMTYFDDRVHAGWYDQWVAFAGQLAAETGAVVAPGQGAWLNTVDGSLRQLQAAVAATGGAVVYSYQQNNADEPHDALLRALPERLWPEPAPALVAR